MSNRNNLKKDSLMLIYGGKKRKSSGCTFQDAFEDGIVGALPGFISPASGIAGAVSSVALCEAKNIHD